MNRFDCKNVNPIRVYRFSGQMNVIYVIIMELWADYVIEECLIAVWMNVSGDG